MTDAAPYPFSAVVGADDAKLALVLAATAPAIGGVLLRGEKGSAKSTLARGLATILPGTAPFVELPVGASEDRLIGSLDLAQVLRDGQTRLRPGLLAAAHGGVLYVDEVNLLPDHLVDALLDVAASGVNRIEREGVAHAHPARFVLVGSMNPEEGELRPQLLDRFGLCVDVGTSADATVRAEAVRRRLDFERAPAEWVASWADQESALRQRVSHAQTLGPADLEPALIEAVSSLCSSMGVEGLRADLVICRAAAGLATWEGRRSATADDVRRVAPFALTHRARRHPLDSHGFEGDDLDRELDEQFPPSSAHPGAGGSDGAPSSPDTGDPAAAEGGGQAPDRGAESGPQAPDRVATGGPAPAVTPLRGPRTRGLVAPTGRRSMSEGPRGRVVGDRVPGPDGPTSVAVGATLRAAAARGEGSVPEVGPGDIREAVREQRRGNLVVLVVDASGSMGADRRMESAKAAVFGLLVDAYQRRDRVSLITFRGEGADVVLRPTASVEVARARLAALPTGGLTPLAAALRAAIDAASTPEAKAYPPLLVVVTDGRATAAPHGEDPWHAATEAATAIGRRRIPSVVVDVERGPIKLGLAAELASRMGARLIGLDELTGPSLVGAIRHAQGLAPP